MSVTCALFGPLRETAGRKHVELAVETPVSVRAVIDALTSEVPGLANHFDDVEPGSSIAITVDGTHITQREGLETPVHDGEIVRMTPPIVGGTT